MEGPALSSLLIRKLEQRDHLSDEERQVLDGIVAHATLVSRGEDLVREGDRPTESKLLLQGFAVRYKLLHSGKRQITAIHVPGDFIDLHSLVLKPMDHAIQALTDCRIGAVPHDGLRTIMAEYPHVARLLMMDIAVDGAIHRQWLAMTGKVYADSRLAHLICELFLRLQAVGQTQGNCFHLNMIQAELADVLGLSTVHVNRTLQKLRRDGLVTWGGDPLQVLDWDNLCKLAEFDSTYLNLHNEPR